MSEGCGAFVLGAAITAGGFWWWNTQSANAESWRQAEAIVGKPRGADLRASKTPGDFVARHQQAVQMRLIALSYATRKDMLWSIEYKSVARQNYLMTHWRPGMRADELPELEQKAALEAQFGVNELTK